MYILQKENAAWKVIKTNRKPIEASNNQSETPESPQCHHDVVPRVRITGSMPCLLLYMGPDFDLSYWALRLTFGAHHTKEKAKLNAVPVESPRRLDIQLRRLFSKTAAFDLISSQGRNIVATDLTLPRLRRPAPEQLHSWYQTNPLRKVI